MCGLVGLAGLGIFKQDIDIFKELMYVNALRGPHSTGLCVVNTNKPNAYAVMKEKVHPAKFLEEYDFDGGPFDVDNKCNLFMGHARYATIGKVTEENAHPFEFSQIIGMHNGTLRDKKYLGDDKTDSELMLADMNLRGIKKVLEELSPSSAFAISVYDKKTKRLYLARNFHRPLYVGLAMGLLFWASECEMLYLVAARGNIKMDVYKLQAGVLYEVDPCNIKTGVKAPWKDINLNLRKYDPVPDVRIKKGTISNSMPYSQYERDHDYSLHDMWDHIDEKVF